LNDTTSLTLAIAAGLFVLGAIGFLTRRNLIIIMLSGETMLHGVSLTLTTFGSVYHTNEGQVFTIFTLVIAACEAGIGLALVLALYQKSRSLDIELWADLRDEGISPSIDSETTASAPLTSPQLEMPKLKPAGRQPDLGPISIQELNELSSHAKLNEGDSTRVSKHEAVERVSL
jgi:NADH-quinone oxidoreductase subunit K